MQSCVFLWQRRCSLADTLYPRNQTVCLLLCCVLIITIPQNYPLCLSFLCVSCKSHTAQATSPGDSVRQWTPYPLCYDMFLVWSNIAYVYLPSPYMAVPRMPLCMAVPSSHPPWHSLARLVAKTISNSWKPKGSIQNSWTICPATTSDFCDCGAVGTWCNREESSASPDFTERHIDTNLLKRVHDERFW